MRNVVAIHQPNFFPWLGFFKKWAKADVFVLLDDVQIPGGGSWINRTHILQNGKRTWLTVPLVRNGFSNKKLTDVLMVDDAKWKRKAKEQFRNGYGKCEYTYECTKLLENNFGTQDQSLLQMNLQGLRQLGEILGLDWSRVVLASSLEIKSSGNQRLIDIVNAVSGSTYLSGDGAQGYQMNNSFPEAGLGLEFLNFIHPEYSQRGADSFTPGLSILDALANLGAKQTRNLLTFDAT